MSNRAVISVENLGKTYRISHQAERQRYVALRDVITDKLQGLFHPRNLRTDDRSTTEDFWALKDVSFEVRQGEVVGIIGRNGAGKSTLLKVLSRITEPSLGRVRIKGRVASLLEVGTGFHPELTGRENIYLNGAILGMTRAEVKKKFDEIVAFAEVERFLDTPVKRYSSGMYVRLAFAVAAHLEPEILVVDEVLAVGDAQFQKKCLGKMQDVATREGRTVLFVSHNMAAVSKLCTSAILMEKGRLVKRGSVPDVAAAYTSSFKKRESSQLSEHKERSGEGTVLFTKLWIEDNAHNTRDEVSSGEGVVIAATYKSKENAILRNVRASFCLTDPLGQILFLASTELTAPEFRDLPPEGIIRCLFPRMPLSGGEYQISPFLEVNGVIQDHIENAGQLKVSDGDFYGSGKLYPDGWQGKSVLVDHQWRLPSL